MKVTRELIEKIEKLEKNNVSADEIKEILDLTSSVAEIKEEFNKNQEFYTVSESAERLKPTLGKLKDEKAYELKVYRLIDKGEILAEKGSNKIGYRIHKDEIERFIEESKMSKEDWKQRALAAEKRIKELEKQMESPKVEETVLEAPEAPEIIEENSEVSEVGEEPKNENLGHSTASEIPEIKISYPKVVRNISDERFEVGFKMDGEEWSGVVTVYGFDVNRSVLQGLESLNSSKSYNRMNDEQLIIAIEEVLFPKIKAKLEKAVEKAKTE